MTNQQDDDSDLAEMERAAAEKGKKGDLYAIDVWLRVRQYRGRRVRLALPFIDDLASFQRAQSTVIAAMSDGELDARDGVYYTTILEHRRRALLTIDLEARIAAVEQTDAPRHVVVPVAKP
jgi:hypothetical protein